MNLDKEKSRPGLEKSVRNDRLGCPAIGGDGGDGTTKIITELKR